MRKLRYSFEDIARFLYPTLLLFREQYGIKNNKRFQHRTFTENDILKLAKDIENCTLELGEIKPIYIDDVRKILITEPSVEFKEFQEHACQIAFKLINTLLFLE